MATHAPITGAPTRAPAILTLSELSCLGGTVQSIAEYVETLAEVVGDHIHDIRALMRDPQCQGINFADVGDWRVPDVLLSLLRRQTEQLAKIGVQIEDARIEGER